MPPKTRTKPRAKGNTSKKRTSFCGDSSSDERDMSAARVVLHRLPRKYSFVKSSTDTEVEQLEQKENEERLQKTDPYDGDMESSSDTQSQTESMMSPSQSSLSSSHEMEQEDTRSVLSPSRKYNKVTNKDCSMSGKMRNIKTYSRKSTDLKEDLGDSGLFVSPDIQRVMKFSASDSSTPKSTVKEKPVEESLFGFEHLMTPEPLPFSPVQSNMPMSSFTSMSSTDGRSSSGVYSMTNSSIGLSSTSGTSTSKRKRGAGMYDIPIAKPAKKIKKKKLTPKQKVELEDWSSKMNAQFDDIEMHELFVE
ncbi:uncharacterized protein LOC144445344 [Glandiceps talaboti]